MGERTTVLAPAKPVDSVNLAIGGCYVVVNLDAQDMQSNEACPSFIKMPMGPITTAQTILVELVSGTGLCMSGRTCDNGVEE